MSSFITRCPQCYTTFNITSSQLQIAEGVVRCGFCLQTFSALEHKIFNEEGKDSDDSFEFEILHIEEEPEEEENERLTDDSIEDDDSNTDEYPEMLEDFQPLALEDIQTLEIPELDAANDILNEFLSDTENQFSEDLPESDSEEEHLVDTESQFSEDLPESDSEEEYSLDDINEAEEIEEDTSPELPRETPPAQHDTTAAQLGKAELDSLSALYDESPFEQLDDSNVQALSDEPIAIHQQRQASSRLKIMLLSANVTLLLTLAAQYGWSHIDDYLLDDRFDSLTGLICSALSCPEVERFDLSRFATEELFVNSHPRFANTLQVDFIFRNTANYPQSFPLVELNFTDSNRRLLANRLFRPEEYLDPELLQFTLMPPQSSVQIQLEIADPGPAAISYSLALRAPSMRN